MNKRTLLLLAAVLILVGLVGMAATWAYFGTSSPASRLISRGVDGMFIEEMIPHHDDAIAMSEMALTEAEHPEIKQLARDIIRTQTRENAQMREWYREWFDTEVPEDGGSMMGGMMSGATDMDALEAAETFDKAFIEEMVPHHQMAIMMSNMLSRRSGRDEMQDFAQTIIDTQSREIAKMREWYDEWYGR